MKRVIVTGASGFIGKAFVKLLLKNDVEVFALVRNANKMSDLKINDKLHIVEIDFSNFDKNKFININNIDTFFHLIWEGGVYGSAFKDYELQLKNAKMTCDALMLAVEVGCKKFVSVGTVNEYEACNYIDDELCKPRYTTIYSASKISTRIMCKTLAYNNNIDLCFGILAKGYGPGDMSKTIVNVVVNNLINGKSPDLVSGENLYDFIYIDDIADALFHIGERGKNFKSYYIGHKNIGTFKEFICKVRDCLNPNVKLNFGVYQDDVAIDYSRINVNELYNDTGFEAKTMLEESIIKTSKWVNKQNIF